MNPNSKIPLILIVIFLVLLELVISIFFVNNPEIPVSIFAIIVLFIASKIILQIWFRDESDRSLSNYFFAAVLIRIILAVFFHNFLQGFFVGDDGLYQIAGNQYADFWSGKDLALQNYASERSGSFPLYIYWNGLLFFLFGYITLIPKIINCFVSAFSAVFVYYIAKEIFTLKIAKYSYLLCLFYPSLILWSTQNIRDPFAIFAITGVMHNTLLIMKGRFSIRNILFTFFSFVILLGIRGYIFVVIALAAFFSFFMGQSKTPVRNFIIAVILIILSNIFYQSVFSKHLIDEFDFKKLSESREALAYGGSAFLTETDVSTPTKALWYLPVGTFYILFAPFPWQLASTLQMATAPETIVWYVLFFFFLRGLYLLLTSGFLSRIAPILLPLTAIVTTYALVEGNIGTAYRHKAQALPFFFIIISVGLVYKNKLRIPKNEFDKQE